MSKEKNIPLKNYILLSVILIITIILVIYLYMWYTTYQDSKLNTPIMDKYLQIVNYNELDNYLVENKDTIIYSSVLNDEKIRSFEIKFRKLISNSSVDEEILYLDLTSELKNKSIKEKIKEKYNFENQNMTNTPSIIIFEDGKITDIYDIKSTNYDINKLENYLVERGVISD